MNETDEFGSPQRPGRPLPLVGVLVGVALLAAMPLIVPRIAPSLPLTTLVVAGALAGLVLWAIALASGLRKGPGWWTATSLVILAGGGALAGYNAARIGHADNAADASTFAEVKLDAEGVIALPSGAARGPVSTAYAELVRADEAEAKAQNERVAKLNPGVLNSPYMLNQTPGILQDCTALDSIANAAGEASTRRMERTDALVAMLETAKLSDAVKQGIVQMVTPPPGSAQAMLAQTREQWQATRDLCTLLAKRSWSNANGFFGFASSADKAAFDALNRRRLAVETERKRLRDAVKARFEAGREQVRAALS